MSKDEAKTAIMRRAVPGRHKLDEKRHREAMVAYVQHIQRSAASKRAWLTRSAPGRVAMPQKASLAQALAVQSAAEREASLPKLRSKKKVAKKVAKKKVAKKAASRSQAKTARPAATAARKTRKKKPTEAKKVGRPRKEKSLVERAAAGVKRASKAATKAVRRVRKAAADEVATAKGAAAKALKSGEDHNMRLVDPNDRKDMEQGLPVWMEPSEPVTEDQKQEQAVS